MAEMSLEEWLGHKTSGGGGNTYLKKWTKRQPPVVNTFMHMAAPLVSVWRHNWPRIVTRDVDGEQELQIWSGQFNSWEPEHILLDQYKRDRDTGVRKSPPTICPMSLTLEWIRQAVDAEDLDWLERVFRFYIEEDDDDDDCTILHAAPMVNAVPRNLDSDEKKQIRRAGLYVKDLWKQNCMAKAQYVLRVVDNDDPTAGTQIAIVTTALGDAVKECISKQMKSLGREEGNPLKTPYCIQWEYRPNETNFSDKYTATALMREEPLPEVLKIISDKSPPDISNLVRRGNASGLKAVMEKFTLVDIPFDKLFAPALAAEEGADDQEVEEAAEEAAARTKETRGKRTTTSGRKKKLPEYDDDVELEACTECGFKFPVDESKCPKCGAEFAAAKKSSKKSSKRRPEPDDDDDDIPF